jgi:DNA-binding LacI/PurR family transcriptional regulator
MQAYRREEERISQAPDAITTSRALIEQTKGMLMFVYGIDADTPFSLLRKQSQQHNAKLRLIAEQILKDLAELSTKSRFAGRLAVDGLLLAAHQRIAHVAARQTDGQSKTDEQTYEMWVARHRGGA